MHRLVLYVKVVLTEPKRGGVILHTGFRTWTTRGSKNAKKIIYARQKSLQGLKDQGCIATIEVCSDGSFESKNFLRLIIFPQAVTSWMILPLRNFIQTGIQA